MTDGKLTEEEAGVRISEMIRDNFERFINVASVDSVYGKPIQQDGSLIIPAAEVIGGMGFGTGFGLPPREGAPAGGQGAQAGGGGGGGGRVVSRPVATIIADREGVRIEPVIDRSRIVLTGMLTGGILGFMFLRLLRRLT